MFFATRVLPFINFSYTPLSESKNEVSKAFYVYEDDVISFDDSNAVGEITEAFSRFWVVGDDKSGEHGLLQKDRNALFRFVLEILEEE